MSTAFSRILMATDFGAEADAALRAAAALARDLGASLHLLHVARDPMLAVNTPDLYGIDWEQLRSSILEDAAGELEKRAGAIAGVTVTCEARIGRPAESIAEAAEQLDADIIVMGTHGRGAMGHLLVGSVADRVIRLAPCPVMTVRASGAVRVRSGEGVAVAHEPAAHAVS